LGAGAILAGMLFPLSLTAGMVGVTIWVVCTIYAIWKYR